MDPSWVIIVLQVLIESSFDSHNRPPVFIIISVTLDNDKYMGIGIDQFSASLKMWYTNVYHGIPWYVYPIGKIKW